MRQSLYLFLIIALFASVIYLLYSLYAAHENNRKLEAGSQQMKEKVKNIELEFGLNVAKANCWSCHKFNYATDNLLEGVVQRVGVKYLKLYITKQDSLLSANDAYALSLKEKFNHMGNSHNFKLTEHEFSALIEFMK